MRSRRRRTRPQRRLQSLRRSNPLPLSTAQNQYQGVIDIEEPVIKVIETALATRTLTPRQMSLLARAGAADFGYSLSWATILEPYATYGIPDDPVGQRQWEATKQLFYETFPPEFAAFTKSFDNAPTKFLHLHAMFVQRDDPLYWMVSKDLLVCQLLEAGKFGFVTGPPGAGKSDYLFGGVVEPLCSLWEDHLTHRERGHPKESRLSRIVVSLGGRAAADPLTPKEDDPDAEAGLPQMKRMGMAGAKDFRVMTNTAFGKDHPYAQYLRFTPSLSAFHIEADRACLEGAYHVEIMDEYGSAEGRGTNNAAKLNLERYARRVRKNDGSLVYASQDEGDLTPWIQKWLDTQIRLKEDHSMVLSISGTPFNYQTVRGIWRTTVPFNTASRSPVINDIPEDDYSAFMGEVERAVGFDDPESCMRKIHKASIRWVTEHRDWSATKAAREADAESKELASKGRRRQSRATE